MRAGTELKGKEWGFLAGPRPEEPLVAADAAAAAARAAAAAAAAAAEVFERRTRRGRLIVSHLPSRMAVFFKVAIVLNSDLAPTESTPDKRLGVLNLMEYGR